jgi:uncharacterized protein (DUF983 family)
MSERKALSAVLEGRCPRCREGRMFAHSIFNLKNMGKMNETCPECGLKYEIEPGFFYGAMYVSYAFSVAILLITTFILYFFLDDPELIVYIISVSVISILFYPVNFRYSRILFLHLFGGIKYKG